MIVQCCNQDVDDKLEVDSIDVVVPVLDQHGDVEDKNLGAVQCVDHNHDNGDMHMPSKNHDVNLDGTDNANVLIY